MKIYIGADHGGFELKAKLIKFLNAHGYEVSDVGGEKLDPEDDFPYFAGKVCNDVLASNDSEARGIVLCRNGQGVCMAANRFKGIRAALGYDERAAKSSRNDDDSKVLMLD